MIENAMGFFSHWKSETFSLLAYQEVTCPAVPILRCSHRIKSYMWEPPSPSVALWRRGSYLVSSSLTRGLAAQWWTQHDSAEGRTRLWWFSKRHIRTGEPTFGVRATKAFYSADLPRFRDVRQQNLSIILCFYVWNCLLMCIRLFFLTYRYQYI